MNRQRISRAIVIVAALSCVPRPLTAQERPTISVAVQITDDSTGGLFTSGFTTALRRLADVQIVEEAESPEFLLRGVVMCDPNCPNALSYSVALALVRPLREGDIGTMMYVATGKAGSDTARIRAFKYLHGYEFPVSSWVARWGRQKYEQAIREMVARIDAQCFEHQRETARAYSLPLDRAKVVIEAMASKEWMC